jgi:hypothetical protein
MSRLTIKGLRAIITTGGLTASGRPFSVSAEALRDGEALVSRLLLGATVPGGSNRSVAPLRVEAVANARTYVGAVCAALLRAGVSVPGDSLTGRREALRALSAPSALIPEGLFPEAGGSNVGARVTTALYRDGETVWAYVLHDDPEHAGNPPGLIRAIREDSGLWRAYLSET